MASADPSPVHGRRDYAKVYGDSFWQFKRAFGGPILLRFQAVHGASRRLTKSLEMNSLSFDKAGSNAKMLHNSGVCRPAPARLSVSNRSVIIRDFGTVGSQNGVRRRSARSVKVHRIEV